ncbi:hypothetical protein AA21291_0365 [Swaminathania salitolerans LMG 21291]|uniref:Uncharacterized protein n=1 Tax=Swaminathania salitolerans TaxID=182838 RepID=A0A511BNI4_9PROT|nr:hypothetical protein AA21291_0365 [Swaminathania salitolerans LMG 21291]GEL01224.1 hypothetical protein SSA02_03870 [Swaminathania salitolerans]
MIAGFHMIDVDDEARSGRLLLGKIADDFRSHESLLPKSARRHGRNCCETVERTGDQDEAERSRKTNGISPIARTLDVVA